MRRLVVLMLLLVAGCDASTEPPATDLLGRLAERTAFEPLVESAEDVGLDAVLASGGPYTVFAPTATAFEYIGSDLRPVLEDPAQRDIFGRLLRHHVVRGRLSPEDLTDGATLTTIDGRTLAVRRVGPVVEVGGVRIRLTDPVEGENGIAYEAADVMFGAITTLERVRLSPSLSTFERLADRAGALALAPASGVTVLGIFEPGFAALGPLQLSLLQTSANADVLRRVLRAHVVPGTPDLIEGSAWTSLDGDLLSVRRVDEQLTVGGRPVYRVEETADGRLVLLGGPIFEVLSLGQRLRLEPASQRFAEWARTLDPALWARLSSDSEDLTVFLPSDGAFQGLGSNVVQVLPQPANRTLLQRLLRVHVVEGRFAPDALEAGVDLVTLNGDTRRAGLEAEAPRYDGRPYQIPEGASVRNGWFYTVGTVVFPRVDGFDTTILRGYTQHALAVRRAGLESLFRSPSLTAFVVVDSLYQLNAAILERPDLADILRYNATFTPLPEPGPATFTTVNGYTREVLYVPCPGRCTPYYFASDTLLVDVGGAAFDGTGYFHSTRGFSLPPP